MSPPPGGRVHTYSQAELGKEFTQTMMLTINARKAAAPTIGSAMEMSSRKLGRERGVWRNNDGRVSKEITSARRFGAMDLSES